MKVLIVPKGKNPYQELLYSEMRKIYSSDEFSYLKISRLIFPFFPIVFAIKRVQGYKIIHIHWLVFHISHKLPLAKLFSYYYTVLCLYVIKFLGYKLVWTVHETTTHDNWTINDLEISRRLSRIASAKITHSKFAMNEMKKANLDMNDTFIVPHGNFISVYPDSISRKAAREKLGLKNKEFVILFFGSIRPYKGVEKLLYAFKKVRSSNVRLVIAGKCRDSSIERKIRRAQKNSKISFYEGYIDDEEVVSFFKACDIVCLPFKKITTSGSAILALSFGKPVITTQTGALLEFPNNVGYLYDPKKPNALEDSLKMAIGNKAKLTELGRNAKIYAESLSWDVIARETYNVYENTLSR